MCSIRRIFDTGELYYTLDKAWGWLDKATDEGKDTEQ